MPGADDRDDEAVKRALASGVVQYDGFRIQPAKAKGETTRSASSALCANFVSVLRVAATVCPDGGGGRPEASAGTAVSSRRLPGRHGRIPWGRALAAGLGNELAQRPHFLPQTVQRIGESVDRLGHVVPTSREVPAPGVRCRVLPVTHGLTRKSEVHGVAPAGHSDRCRTARRFRRRRSPRAGGRCAVRRSGAVAGAAAAILIWSNWGTRPVQRIA